MDGLQDRMKTDLTTALKVRDRAAVTALRTALAAVSNAEALSLVDDRYREPVLGELKEAPRRSLTEEQVAEILRAEAAERQSAIAEYESLGLGVDADRLRAEVAVLHRYLSAEG